MDLGPFSVSCSEKAQATTDPFTEVTCPVFVGAQPELTPSKRQKMGPGAYKINLLNYAIIFGV